MSWSSTFLHLWRQSTAYSPLWCPALPVHTLTWSSLFTPPSCQGIMCIAGTTPHYTYWVSLVLKWEIVVYTEGHENRAAGHAFDINETSIYWRNNHTSSFSCKEATHWNNCFIASLLKSTGTNCVGLNWDHEKTAEPQAYLRPTSHWLLTRFPGDLYEYESLRSRAL